MKLLLEKWHGYLNESKLRVFDFDDTLVQTDAKIILHKASGDVVEQTPGEWAIYKPQAGDKFNFDQFGTLINPREIKEYTDILRRVLSAGTDGRKTVILTARAKAARGAITEFLEDIGIDISELELVTLNSSDPQTKADWIGQKIEEGYNDIFFLDDSAKNVAAVQALKKIYPNIKLKAQLV
jgi:hypothetical protein